jgi:hypothetical protein
VTPTRVRAAAHIHSEWSDDGTWTLAALVDAFAERGADVLLMSEHSRGLTAGGWVEFHTACAKASTPQLLVVPGIEYNDLDNVVHVLVWGDLPFYGRTPDIGRLLEQLDVDGGVAVLAHPWRRQAFERIEDEWVGHLTAIELWNRKYDGWAPNRAAADLAGAAGLPMFAGLDFHRSRQFFPLRVEVDVDRGVAEGLTPAMVYAALRDHRFVSRYRGREAADLYQGMRGRAASGAERARRAVARGLRTLPVGR